MDHDFLVAARRLDDQDLLTSARSLAELGRRTTAQLVAHLAEIERRGLHLAGAYESIFEYCRGGLSLSEGEAYNRMVGARAVRRFPVILDLLTAGSITLTTITVLEKHLQEDNHLELLHEAAGKRKSELLEIVARLQPQPDVKTSVRREAMRPPVPTAFQPALGALPSVGTSPPPAKPPASTVVAPLAPERYRFQTTISRRTLDKLRAAKDLLRHAIPEGEDDAVLERALDVLLRELDRKRFALSRSPRASTGTAPDARHLPAAVKRAVAPRNEKRCGFVGPDGQRCPARAFLEYHHRQPYMAGGQATVENLVLHCRRHNGHEARRFFAAREV
jgi:hypothetical protein